MLYNDTVTSVINYSLLSDSIIDFGKNYLHTRYRFGGMSVNGFDCSGFTSFVYRNFGYQLPRSSAGQANRFLGIKKSELQRGDLVFFNGRKRGGKRVGHVGIVTDVDSDGTFDFIHASVKRGVIVSHSDETYYVKRYVGAGRVFEEAENFLAKKENILQDAGKEETMEIPNSQNVEIGDEQISIQNPQYHTVKAGETLFSIARQYQISQQDLKDYNELTSNYVRAGQKLIVGEQNVDIQEITDLALTEQTAEQEDEKLLYTVQKGDTLYSISKTYGCTIAQLR
ncbi:MAG: C40 family peptidase, partial [Prevotellaceae bacterium]|nr:C40 family peptidase [Prevotellaceae bacterium]